MKTKYQLRRGEHIHRLLQFLSTAGAPIRDLEKQRLGELTRHFREHGTLPESAFRQLTAIYDRCR